MKTITLNYYNRQRNLNNVSSILSELFSRAPSATRIIMDLRDNNLSDYALEEIGKALSSKNLQQKRVTLLLKNNNIGSKDDKENRQIEHFVTAFMSRASRLEPHHRLARLQLKLDSNKLNDNDIEELMKIHSLLGKNFSYSLENNKISGAHFPELFMHFSSRLSLIAKGKTPRLSLQENNIDKDSFSTIMKVLLGGALPARAWVLDLSQNNIGNDSMPELCQTLKQLSNAHRFTITLKKKNEMQKTDTYTQERGASMLMTAFQSRLIPYGTLVRGILPNQPAGQALLEAQKENQYYYSRIINLLLRVEKEHSIKKQRSSLTLGLLKLSQLEMSLIVEYIAPLLKKRFTTQFLAINVSSNDTTSDLPQKKM